MEAQDAALNLPSTCDADELRELDAACALVASGGAPRVTVVGVRHRLVLQHGLEVGADHDLRVRAHWWPSGNAMDIVVERDG